MRMLLGAVTAAVVLVAGQSAPASARPAHRADLTVAGGSVQRSGDRLTATVAVRNVRSSRGARARRTAVALVARSGTVTRALAGVRLPALANGRTRRVGLSATTTGLAAGTWTVEACADPGHLVRERREGNNCRVLGRVSVAATAAGLCGTPLCAPLSLATDDEASYTDATGTYWTYIPSDLGSAPAAVLIWLHGCGGDHGDAWGAADYWSEHYIALLPDGAEGGCWDMDTGPDRVVAAVRSAIAHFPVDPKRIVIGGYSSGGDLAYRTAFLHADLFAGLLAMNTAPFRDNGTSAAVAAQAAWRLPVYHLAHDQDETYPLAEVQAEIDQLEDAGFPVSFEHVAGEHWSEPSYDGAPDGTWWDFQHRVVRDHMGLGWTAP
ncbi:MAG: CARDB domain-containing protein [Nocardioides sp.]|uniref:CARDB domain-containing protein n=1 Tax=Nocardioides sp. TaxID=35761 RepID=UPI0039E2DDA7